MRRGRVASRGFKAASIAVLELPRHVIYLSRWASVGSKDSTTSTRTLVSVPTVDKFNNIDYGILGGSFAHPRNHRPFFSLEFYGMAHAFPQLGVCLLYEYDELIRGTSASDVDGCADLIASHCRPSCSAAIFDHIKSPASVRLQVDRLAVLRA